jgi:hypothetical protein
MSDKVISKNKYHTEFALYYFIKLCSKLIIDKLYSLYKCYKHKKQDHKRIKELNSDIIGIKAYLHIYTTRDLCLTCDTLFSLYWKEIENLFKVGAQYTFKDKFKLPYDY